MHEANNHTEATRQPWPQLGAPAILCALSVLAVPATAESDLPSANRTKPESSAAQVQAPTRPPHEEADTAAPLVPVDLEGVEPIHRTGAVLLAGQPTVEAFGELRDRGVNLVIDLRQPGEARGFDQAELMKTLGLRYELLPIGGSHPLTDATFDRVRFLLREHDPAQGEVLLHCASSNRVGAVWATARVLDQGVRPEVAFQEAEKAGLRSAGLKEAAQHYILGAGNQELGAFKLKIRKDYPSVPRLGVDALEAQLAAPASAPLMLDVRAQEEYAVSHLPGALNASTIEGVRSALAETSKDRAVVLYCSVGLRSARMAKRLLDDGRSNVRNLEGSIFEWANAGKAVYRGTERASLVHPFDKKWGELLKPELRAPLAGD